MSFTPRAPLLLVAPDNITVCTVPHWQGESSRDTAKAPHAEENIGTCTSAELLVWGTPCVTFAATLTGEPWRHAVKAPYAGKLVCSKCGIWDWRHEDESLLVKGLSKAKVKGVSKVKVKHTVTSPSLGPTSSLTFAHLQR